MEISATGKGQAAMIPEVCFALWLAIAPIDTLLDVRSAVIKGETQLTADQVFDLQDEIRDRDNGKGS